MPTPGAPRPHYPGDVAAAHPARLHDLSAGWAELEPGTVPSHPRPDTAAPSPGYTPSPPQSGACPSPTREAPASPPPRPAFSSPVSARPCQAEIRSIAPSNCLSLLRRVDGFLMAPVDGFSLSPHILGSALRLADRGGAARGSSRAGARAWGQCARVPQNEGPRNGKPNFPQT